MAYEKGANLPKFFNINDPLFFTDFGGNW